MSTKLIMKLIFFKDINLKHYQLQLYMKNEKLKTKALQTTKFPVSMQFKKCFYLFIFIFWGQNSFTTYKCEVSSLWNLPWQSSKKKISQKKMKKNHWWELTNNKLTWPIRHYANLQDPFKSSKMVTNSFGNGNSMQPMGRAQHALMNGPVFSFLRGEGFSKNFPYSHQVPKGF